MRREHAWNFAHDPNTDGLFLSQMLNTLKAWARATARHVMFDDKFVLIVLLVKTERECRAAE